MNNRFRIAILATLITLPQLALAADALWRIQGVDETTAENIQKRLGASRRILGADVTSAEFDRFINESRSDIELAMQPYGYFHPTLQTTYFKKKNTYYVTLTIQPGPRTKVRRVEVRLIGQGAKANQDLIKQFGIQPNSPLSIPTYQEAKAFLFNHLQARGYIKTVVAHSEVLIDRKNNVADIHVVMNTGDRYYFGLVTFGDQTIEGKLLARYIPFHVGAPYSSALLLKLQDNLLLSRYFQNVVVEPDMNAIKNHHVPLFVRLEPRKARLYLAGVGYSTDIGPRGTLGIDWRRVNQAGHRMQAIIKGSNRYYDAQAQYSIPGLAPLTDVLTFSTSFFHHNIGQVNTKGFNTIASYTERWHRWQRTLSFKFLRELSYNNDLLNHNTTWLYPELTFKKVMSDNEINTSHGFRVLLSTQAATQKLISSDDFWQFHADAKYIHTFNTKTRILLHGEAGVTWVNDINRIAPSLQFYAGGSQSIRAYSYQGLGPGRYLLQAGIEVQQPVYKDWGIAAFYDVGNAFNDRHEFNPKKSIGLGIVRRSPIGSINFGYAKSIGPAPKEHHFVISFGPDL